ncbi:hypothetical protein NE237_032422 [Protea cynaroides]|uniref:Uncharacterized protein n=1 Tax=Protea cynaroides TaxID=273540 RepID=A0A9Q0R3I5_9MAGN|nr:hypothetical protein NE237_032422 [Protea cynaroides]
MSKQKSKIGVFMNLIEMIHIQKVSMGRTILVLPEQITDFVSLHTVAQPFPNSNHKTSEKLSWRLGDGKEMGSGVVEECKLQASPGIYVAEEGTSDGMMLLEKEPVSVEGDSANRIKMMTESKEVPFPAQS